MKGWGRVLESDGRMENFRRAEEGSWRREEDNQWPGDYFHRGEGDATGMKGKGIFGRRARSGRIEGLIWAEFWIGEGMGRRPTRRAKSRNGAAGDLPADRRERSRYSHAIVSQRARVREKKPRRRKRRGYYRAASSSPRCSFAPSFPPPLVPAEQS